MAALQGGYGPPGDTDTNGLAGLIAAMRNQQNGAVDSPLDCSLASPFGAPGATFASAGVGGAGGLLAAARAMGGGLPSAAPSAVGLNAAVSGGAGGCSSCGGVGAGTTGGGAGGGAESGAHGGASVVPHSNLRALGPLPPVGRAASGAEIDIHAATGVAGAAVSEASTAAASGATAGEVASSSGCSSSILDRLNALKAAKVEDTLNALKAAGSCAACCPATIQESSTLESAISCAAAPATVSAAEASVPSGRTSDAIEAPSEAEVRLPTLVLPTAMSGDPSGGGSGGGETIDADGMEVESAALNSADESPPTLVQSILPGAMPVRMHPGQIDTEPGENHHEGDA